MPPSRSAATPERGSAPLLVTVMKDNAELKAALVCKTTEVRAAEKALEILAAEAEGLETMRDELATAQRELQAVTQRLHAAQDEIDLLRATMRQRDDALDDLEHETRMLRDENWHLRSAREEERYKSTHQLRTSGHTHIPEPLPSYTPMLLQATRIWTPAGVKPMEATQAARTIVISVKTGFPPANTIGKFDGPADNVDLSQAPHRIRPLLFIPGRILWSRARGGHAIAYAPTHEFVNGIWRPHSHLTSLASPSLEVDLLCHQQDRLYYMGVYRVLSLRSVPGCVAVGDIPPDISRFAVFRAMRVRQHDLEDTLKLAQNPKFAATTGPGRPTVESFGLQLLGYDDGVRDMLSVYFRGVGACEPAIKATPMAQTQFKVWSGPKRKWDPSDSQRDTDAAAPDRKKGNWTRSEGT
ncbi:hypothetical protein MIND_00389000 [Mycena indigotica]|uniref:Uncharacterized protein n=1 Tax=Mycena indigotica TaxID=2126181 RepID=A0A8H6WBE7_9AGAR|nr:uncharacterized protein MIND_00389000 [Mycena indigotica]KAF7310156.1 hypothetical protein MIND_00389000 [Mycena indigotica]